MKKKSIKRAPRCLIFTQILKGDEIIKKIESTHGESSQKPKTSKNPIKNGLYIGVKIKLTESKLVWEPYLLIAKFFFDDSTLGVVKLV